tara:strand:+ start:393 stop:677 length:285 start_codon:yes stop_codon:yes gene_type:complete
MKNCLCADGRIVTRGQKPPADCNSSRTTGCEGCCDGGVSTGKRAMGTSIKAKKYSKKGLPSGFIRSTSLTPLNKKDMFTTYQNIKDINRNIYNL